MRQAEFESAVKAYLKRADLSQAAAARRLHYTPEQFNKWIRGVNRIPDTAIQELAELLDLTEAERIELFSLAGYVAVRAVQPPAAGNPQDNNLVTPASPPLVLVRDVQRFPAYPGGAFFWDALKNWADNFFGWSQASPHARSSWAGVGFVGVIGLGWGLWGRKRFRKSLSVHPSFWALLIATGIGLYLLKWSPLPFWSNGPGFGLAALALIRWAYSQAQDRAAKFAAK